MYIKNCNLQNITELNMKTIPPVPNLATPSPENLTQKNYTNSSLHTIIQQLQ